MSSRELTAFNASPRLAAATLDWAESFEGTAVPLLATEQRAVAEGTGPSGVERLELLNFPSRPLLCPLRGQQSPAPQPIFTAPAARQLGKSKWLRVANEQSLASNLEAGVFLATQEETIFLSM